MLDKHSTNLIHPWSHFFAYKGKRAVSLHVSLGPWFSHHQHITQDKGRANRNLNWQERGSENIPGCRKHGQEQNEIQKDNIGHGERRRLERQNEQRDQVGCSHHDCKQTVSELWKPSSNGQMSQGKRNERSARLDSQSPQRDNHGYLLNHVSVIREMLQKQANYLPDAAISEEWPYKCSLLLWMT